MFQDEHALGGPSLWNSSIVSTLQDPSASNNSNHSPLSNQVQSPITSDPSTTPTSVASSAPAPSTPAAAAAPTKSKKTSNRNNSNGGSKRSSNKSKSKLSRVRYFLHPGEPPVGQIVSDSLTDGQDNNNTLSLKQPQVTLLPNSYIGPSSSSLSLSVSHFWL